MRKIDTRGWALIGLFGMAFYIFTLMALDPALTKDELFSVLATAMISGGLGGALGFYFGSSQGGVAKDATIASMVVPPEPEAKP